jgi:glycosyltransferase involved in cell wall biosynthesis
MSSSRTDTLPRISVVTPSFNQGRFLEATIRSVLDQNYPNLEYIIMDGGSTDNSVEIIKKYQARLTYWQSQKDRGQNHAITEGFKHSTGEILAYLNSDDIHFPWTLDTVAQIFRQRTEVVWLTPQTTMVIDADGDPLTTNHAISHTRLRFYSGVTLGNFFGESGWIQQEGTFWKRSLWEAAGARMDEDAYRTGDFELWARFFQYANLSTTRIPLAAYRLHDSNKTQLNLTIQECRKILKGYPHEKKYNKLQFRFMNWLHRRTGRFADRFGARECRIYYDIPNGKWLRHTANIF